MPAFEHASRATKGARNYQEDNALFWSGFDVTKNACLSDATDGAAAVAVLADGMGGHTGGALASRMACERFIQAFLAATGSNRERLVAALSAANRAIAETVEADPMLSGMGSTLVGVTFAADGIEWVSVGDSP